MVENLLTLDQNVRVKRCPPTKMETPIISEEVLKACRSIQNRKAVGIDDFQRKFVKYVDEKSTQRHCCYC